MAQFLFSSLCSAQCVPFLNRITTISAAVTISDHHALTIVESNPLRGRHTYYIIILDIRLLLIFQASCDDSAAEYRLL